MTHIIKFSRIVLKLVFLISLSQNVYGNTISNCSTCGGGFGDELGEIIPKDNYFRYGSLILECPKRKNSSYKNGNNWQTTLRGYYNKNFMWFFKNTNKKVQIILGYKTNEKNVRIEGMDIWLPDKSKKKIFGVYKSTENISTLADVLMSFPEVNRKDQRSSNNNRLCRIRGNTPPVNYIKKEFLFKYTIGVLKRFESDQYKVINELTRHGFRLNARFKLTDAISKLSIELAKLENTPKIIVQKDKESKKLAEQRALELEEERTRLKAMEIERKRLEEKTKQLAEENRLAELKAKKRSEEIAKEVAAQERAKLAKEKALRLAEEKARKIAQEKAKKLAEERKKAEALAKKLERERKLAEQKNKERLKKLDEERKKSEKIAEQLRKERELAEKKARELEKSQQTQLASIQKEKAKREQLIQEEKKKRVELEKKLVELREQNINQQSNTGGVKSVKLPPEWMPYSNDMSLQQKQFCQLTNRFFKDMEKAISSGNEIKVNIVHKERQENMDGLLPGGKVNNWIFKVVKIDQVEDGSAAVVLQLQCKSFVGSGQIHTKSTWRKKSNKEWRATIPYKDRRFRELAKLDKGQFILGSGTMLEINAFKPGQKETFYASQLIGEHPLTKGLNLNGELFVADLSYIAALN